jgi:pyridoxamine 5'-phosphate oxidase
MDESIAKLREDYRLRALDETDLLDDPLQLFRRWLDEACNAKVKEPNAMVLATVDSSGQPFTRTVLLKDMDADGLVFYTNFGSRKASHIAANASVSLLFLWLDLERQVSINGTATKLSSARSLRYFLSRPLGSRLGAWASQQSSVISSRSLLEAKMEQMRSKFADGKVPLPDFWGGYQVRPTSVEFWQGRQNRLHDRFLYSRSAEAGWSHARLQP